MLRLAPLRVRRPLFYRKFARRAASYVPLYDDAPLALALVSLRLVPTDVPHEPIALTGVHELSVSRVMVSLARKGGLLVEVGANYGYYACLWTGQRDGNRVIAFEPLAANAVALRENVERNGLTKRVAIEETAVGRDNGFLRFREGAAGQTGQGGFSASGEPAEP